MAEKETRGKKGRALKVAPEIVDPPKALTQDVIDGALAKLIECSKLKHSAARDFLVSELKACIETRNEVLIRKDKGSEELRSIGTLSRIIVQLSDRLLMYEEEDGGGIF